MIKEELEQIIEKYRHLSIKFESRDEEKSQQYERFAEWVKDNINTFEYIYDEKELWELFLDYHDEDLDSMFPEGDEDDSITDWMTKD